MMEEYFEELIEMSLTEHDDDEVFDDAEEQ